MKRLIVLILLMVCTGFADNAWSSPADTIKVGLGAISGFIAHEAGHYMVGFQQNTSVEYRGGLGGDMLVMQGSRAGVKNTAAGGFMAQITSTEMILGIDSEPGSYAWGWLAYNLINAVQYVAKDQILGGYGDLDTMDRRGMDSDMFGAALVSHALWSAYRISGGPDGGARPYVGYDPVQREAVFGFVWKF